MGVASSAVRLWRHLQFDSLGEWESFSDPEPGEETQFELLPEGDLDGAALRDPQLHHFVGAAGGWRRDALA
jgi:hypothetical protein